MPSTSRSTLALLVAPALLASLPSAYAVSLSSVIQAWNLTQNTYNFTGPNSIENSDDASSYIIRNWDTNYGHLDWGTNNVVFSPDPSTYPSQTLVRRAHSSTSTGSSTGSASRSSSTQSSSSYVTSPNATNLNGESPVLRVEYPAGSYSGATGGTQWTSDPFTGGLDPGYQRMLLAYDVWFPTGYAWNQGGKLPGLRGGPNATGCSGGSQADGESCFSTRIMWRSGGQGEVYAYIPTSQKNFCSSSNVICNSDYGTSLSRGSFTFATGQWNTIWLLVVLNDPSVANGVVQLWFNGAPAISFNNLELRSSSSLASVSGMFFSTFFGGSDSTWATPTTQYTYYRNMQLYAGAGQANGTGSKISGDRSAHTLGGKWVGVGALSILAASVGASLLL